MLLRRSWHGWASVAHSSNLCNTLWGWLFLPPCLTPGSLTSVCWDHLPNKVLASKSLSRLCFWGTQTKIIGRWKDTKYDLKGDIWCRRRKERVDSDSGRAASLSNQVFLHVAFEPRVLAWFFCRPGFTCSHSLALVGTESKVVTWRQRDEYRWLGIKLHSSYWSVMLISQATPWILTSSFPDVQPALWAP